MTNTRLSEVELAALQERLEHIGGPLFAHDGVRQTDSANVLCLIAEIRGNRATDLCDDCPPANCPTDKTRCAPCPRRALLAAIEQETK